MQIALSFSILLGKTRRVHLIAHSMGGQTARLLAHLLRNGDETERNVDPEGLSLLFEGGKQWIKSITTLSSPHNGTTIVNNIDLDTGRTRFLLVQRKDRGDPVWQPFHPSNNHAFAIYAWRRVYGIVRRNCY